MGYSHHLNSPKFLPVSAPINGAENQVGDLTGLALIKSINSYS